MISWYQKTKFIHPPTRGETLREFIDWNALRCAEYMKSTLSSELDPRVSASLVFSTPVNVIICNSCENQVSPLPPAITNVIGLDSALHADEEYCFVGEYGSWLFHISRSQYDWIGDIEMGECQVYDEGIVLYEYT